MKKAPTSNWLSFPGEDGRVWWRRQAGAAGFRMAESPRKGERAIYAFAAADCDSIPLWVNSAEPEIVARVLEMELERVGTRLPDGPGEHLAWRTVGSDGPRRLIHAMVIPPSLETELTEMPVEWAEFYPAPLLLTPPARSIVLWCEVGRWIVGFTHDEEWVYFQNLGPGEFTVDLLREVQCIHLDLDGRRMVGTIDVLTLWTDDYEPPPASFRDEVHRILGLPTRATPMPEMSLAQEAMGRRFLPASVAAERLKQERLRRWMGLSVAASLVFLLLVGAGTADLILARKENDRLRLRVESLQPTASVMREAQERWEALRPAVDVDNYPVEMFHQVASIFPEKGLRLTHFEIRENGDIVLRGEASSVPVAIGFKANLENAPGLDAYRWTIPPPDIQGETATFLATGSYRFAQVDP